MADTARHNAAFQTEANTTYGGNTYMDGTGAYQSGNTVSQIRMERETGKRTVDKRVILFVMIALCFVCGVVFSHFQQLQVKTDLREKQTEYELLQSENIRLQSEIASKTSNKNVQEYAENVLGMQKINASQIEYVQIQTADVIELPEEEKNIFVKIKEWFDGMVEYFRG